MNAVPFALLAAAGNALASVLQRHAARSAPRQAAFRPALIWDLARRPVWLAGILALTVGFVLQAVALSMGGLALVQPLLVAELPFTMILVAWTSRIGLDRRTWLAVGALTAGLAGLLAGAAPSESHRQLGGWEWVISAIATIGTITGLVAAARLCLGAARAAVLGVAAGIGFAFTATFMKEAATIAEQDVSALPASWEPYAMVAAGLGSLFLLQNALHSGTLVAAQPALTISDPVASILYGVLMFGEQIRSGPWIALEAAGVGLILYGSVRLAQSAPIRAYADAT